MPKDMKIRMPDGSTVRIDGEKIAAELNTFDMNNVRLSSMTYELTKSHPGKWVALEGGELFIADNVWELWVQLGDRASRAAHAYLDPTERKFILAKVA